MESGLQMWKLQHTKEDKTDVNCKIGLKPKSLTLISALLLLLALVE